MTYELAHIVLVPFLWIYGYDIDSESITTAHDAIEVQRRDAERYAKENKIGLWVDKNPMASWDWRRGKG